MILEAGKKAPEFTLINKDGKNVSLSTYAGKNIVLVFYPADWSPVCGDQISLYSEMTNLFDKNDAQLLGISVDGMWCHSAFIENRNLKIPLLSDFEPKGKISKLYGVYNEEYGISKRALFVIDKKGIIQWSKVYPNEENPGADVIFDALDEL